MGGVSVSAHGMAGEWRVALGQVRKRANAAANEKVSGEGANVALKAPMSVRRGAGGSSCLRGGLCAWAREVAHGGASRGAHDGLSRGGHGGVGGCGEGCREERRGATSKE